MYVVSIPACILSISKNKIIPAHMDVKLEQEVKSVTTWWHWQLIFIAIVLPITRSSTKANTCTRRKKNILTLAQML